MFKWKAELTQPSRSPANEEDNEKDNESAEEIVKQKNTEKADETTPPLHQESVPPTQTHLPHHELHLHIHLSNIIHSYFTWYS
jgi:hypothetical protein